MLRLRPFKQSDAKYIVNWVKDERVFAMWSAYKFSYPLTQQQLLDYKEMYEKDEHAWIFVALDEVGIPVGHLLMRMADYEKQSVHFGFIVLDPDRRGKGYGKEMVGLAVKYAYEILGVNKITLGVYANNEVAHSCYKAVGFKDKNYQEEALTFQNEKWGLYDMMAEKAE